MRVYFCSDLHASRKCWKKFLASGKFYDADVVVVGGDITGKFVVPIVEQARGVRTATFLGVERRVSSPAELERLKTWIADNGQYPFETTPDERDWYAEDQTRVDELFKRLALERVADWVAEADDKLAGSGRRVFVSGANDDVIEVDDALAASAVMEDPNGRVLQLDGGFEFLGMGWGNVTPWACPRDLPEEDLAARIDAVAAQARDPSRTIFSLHVPPYGSGLDAAPELDADLRPQLDGGGFRMVPVGSTAVRDAIATYRPLIGLHGHIHESKGVKRLAGVPVVNPGSEYAEGVLGGAVIELDARGVRDIRLVTG